jgi:glycosyltransferase involved in cell wall biosynthesis
LQRGPVTAENTIKPLVSILIPAFNAEEWVADTLKSALGQTWPNTEVIVVDDGSTDGTLSIARQFASSAVSVISRPHLGAAAARNHAFSLSKGDYIQWLDADDLLAPDKITRQMEASQQCASKRTLFSSSWSRFMYRVGRAQSARSVLWCDLSPVEWLVRKMEQNVFMQTTSWLVSRELTLAAGPWDTRLLADDDGEYFCRVIGLSDCVKFVPGAQTFWRNTGVHGLSYLGLSQEKIKAHFVSMESQIAHLRKLEDSSRVRAACLRYLQNFLINIYPERRDILKQAQQLAAALGGTLGAPALSWKYAYVQKVFGWGVAKRMRLFLPNLKRGLGIFSDKIMFALEAKAAPERRGCNQVSTLP